MYDITRFTLADMARCGAELREAGAKAASLEAVAEAIVESLYENLHDAKGRACVMVRLYTTHQSSQLPAEMRELENRSMPAKPPAHGKCLTLLGTAGDLPEWNSRRAARGYRAILSPNGNPVDCAPIVAEIARQFGLDLGAILATPPGAAEDLNHRTCNVFFVPDASSSPFIPAQADFVVSHGVKSALGFGGMLPAGNLFAVIIFTRVPIPADTAQMFRTIALNVKMNLLRFAGGKVFAD